MELIQKKSILFLHGFTQNSLIFNKRLKVIIKELAQKFKNYDFLIPDGPHILELSDIEPDEGYKRGWLYVNEENKMKFEDWDTIQSINYLGLKESVKQLENLSFNNNKNIECIFGFSQGALVTIFISLLYQNKLKEVFPNLKCVVIVAGFIDPLPLNEELKDIVSFEGKINIPSLHIYGSLDEFITPFKSERATKLFYNPEVYIHPGKHFIPSSKQDVEIISNFMKQYLI